MVAIGRLASRDYDNGDDQKLKEWNYIRFIMGQQQPSSRGTRRDLREVEEQQQQLHLTVKLWHIERYIMAFRRPSADVLEKSSTPISM